MKRSKDLWLEEQEKKEYGKMDEHQVKGPLPIINLNTIKAMDEIVTVDDELINMTSARIAQKIIAAIRDGYIDLVEFVIKKKLIDNALEMVLRDADVKKKAEKL